MTLTGTDASLATCRMSGYPVVHHRGSRLDPHKMYTVTVSNPRYWYGGELYRVGTPTRLLYERNEYWCYEDLREAFLRGGKGIKDFCDFENCPYPAPADGPTFSDMASLFLTLMLWGGLD